LVGAGCEKTLKVQIRDVSPAGSSAASSATVVADDEEESSESGDGIERILKRKLRDKWAWAEEEDEGDDEGTDRYDGDEGDGG